jgi:hypothetical protein
MVLERIALKTLQRFHHDTLNVFSDQETLVDAVQNRPGIFGANPVSFLSVRARRPGIRVADLDEALLNDRSLLRVSAFRGSLFLLSSADYPLYYRALSNLLQTQGTDRLQQAGIDERQLFRCSFLLRESQFELPRSMEQLSEVIFPALKKKYDSDVLRLLFRKLCDAGVLVRTSSRGWRGNEFAYALLEKWLPDLHLTGENPESARTEIVRRYLRTYGPASLEDIAWWTGFGNTQIQRSIGHLRREAVRFPVEGFRDDLVGLRECVDLLKKPAQTRPPIQFLPPWDPFTFGWSNKRRIVEKEWQPWVFDHGGNAASTIVEGGKVVGIWQFRDAPTSMFEFHVFAPYASKRREVFHAAEEFVLELAELASAPSIQLFERELGRTLCERGRAAFMWPLGKEIPKDPRKIRETASTMERRTSNTFRSRYLDAEHLVRPNSEAALS